MKKILTFLLIVLIIISLTACNNTPQDKLYLLNEESLTIELGDDLDLTLDKYIDTSDLSEEDLSNTTIKLVSATRDNNGNIKDDAKEIEPTALGF